MISELAVRATDALRRAYTPRVERASKRVGLHALFVRVHDGLWRLLISIGYLLAGDRARVAVGGAEASFHVTSRTEYERATTLVGERAVVEALLAEVAASDTFWDVGANVGLYTCLVADRLADGGVVAFEPHPGNAERLRRNLRLNGLDAALDRRALSDAEGEAALHVVGQEAGAGAHTLKGSADADGRVDVTLARGDALVADGEYDLPNLVKVDVEGAELEVLRGMEGTLADPDCRAVFVEVHRSHGVGVSEVRDLLETAGFAVERLQDRGSTTFLGATKPDAEPDTEPGPEPKPP